MKVTQIGVGYIGSIYARQLLRAKVDLTVYDASSQRMEALTEVGAKGAKSLLQAVESADCLLVALPDPDAVRSVMLGADGAIASLPKGSAILDVSTIDPDTALSIEAAAKKRQILYVEAPVSGGEPESAGTDGAKKRNVTFMAGGEVAAFAATKPLMSLLGKYPLHLGPTGTGAKVNLISNYMSGLHNLVAAEAFALGRAAGIPIETLLKAFEHTDANSYWLFNYFAPRILSGDFQPGFSVDLQYKDLRLCEDLARRHKVPMPLNGLALQLYQVLRGQGRGSRDLVEAANLAAEMSGQNRY